MEQVKNGDTVRIHYTGWCQNGEVFDTSRDSEPMEITIGGGSIITGFEKRLVGMKPGERRTFTIPPEQAFGERREELVVKVKRTNFPQDYIPVLGQRLQIIKPDGGTIDITIVGIQNGTVTIDANHPLAGQSLYFEVELLEIEY